MHKFSILSQLESQLADNQAHKKEDIISHYNISEQVLNNYISKLKKQGCKIVRQSIKGEKFIMQLSPKTTPLQDSDLQTIFKTYKRKKNTQAVPLNKIASGSYSINSATIHITHRPNETTIIEINQKIQRAKPTDFLALGVVPKDVYIIEADTFKQLYFEV